jgi:hypothetical protein
MADRRHRRPLSMPSRQEFARHMGRGIIIASALIAVSLSVGVLGYHVTAGLGWVDSILNASMILTGMGPVSPLPNDGAKLFASAYALFSGVIFIASAGVAVGPVAHRFLHRFHVELDDPEQPVVLPAAKSGRPEA